MIVRFTNVSKVFNSDLLIDKVSFNLNKGEITTIIGPNGVGKTTIAKIILGLEKASSGEVEIKKGISIGYVPQGLKFNKKIPLDVKTFLNVLTPNTLESYENKSILEFCDFYNLKYKDISKISEGQFQKFLIASAILNKPDFLVLDEPTQFLDINSQQEFYSIIENYRNNLGATILIISHDLFTVIKSSDKVICFYGHICCSGRPKKSKPYNDLTNSISSIGLYSHFHNHKH